jgi:ribonuclease I
MTCVSQAHEWNKHGTCALRELPSEHKFFKTVVNLNWKINLEVRLDRE